MKKIIFLVKLSEEKKLEIIELSEEIKESYIKKSESNLISAKILLDNNRLEESISLAYYSMYNMLTALLFKTGIKCENHNASIILMKEIFNLDNSEIFNAKKERIDKQYYTNFYITKSEVTEQIKTSEIFNSKILDFISRISNKDIEHFRIKLKSLI